MKDFPLIVSADDHVLEPKDLWSSRLPAKYEGIGPRVVRERGTAEFRDGVFTYETSNAGELVDVWYYEDVRVPSMLTGSAVGYELEEMETKVVTYEDMRPGCYDPKARLADMDLSGVEASLCFPNMFARFAGQRFVFGTDKELSKQCVRAYNDFMLDEWCGDSAGRLIPLGILPLWDADLCADEVRLMSSRGIHAMCFTEIPYYLGLPSLHTTYWDPLFRACEETSTVLMMHIGSGSKLPSTSPDAPAAVLNTLPSVNAAMSMVDWLFSGALTRFPGLKLGFAECQIGWIPYFLERSDEVWEHNRGWNEVWGKIPEPPSSYFPDHIFCTFFSDNFGLRHLDEIGADNVMFETDYPHSDSNWPDSREVAMKQTEFLDDETTEKVVRGNARRLFGLT
ncbi:MAG TPA: amidohydrolase family protein [Acidimicrobiales bacterium]